MYKKSECYFALSIYMYVCVCVCTHMCEKTIYNFMNCFNETSTTYMLT